MYGSAHPDDPHDINYNNIKYGIITCRTFYSTAVLSTDYMLHCCYYTLSFSVSPFSVLFFCFFATCRLIIFFLTLNAVCSIVRDAECYMNSLTQVNKLLATDELSYLLVLLFSFRFAFSLLKIKM